MKSLKNYFDNFSEWNFENYLKLNNFTYKQYQEVEEGLTLESKQTCKTPTNKTIEKPIICLISRFSF